jgi:hypothetical protein
MGFVENINIIAQSMTPTNIAAIQNAASNAASAAASAASIGNLVNESTITTLRARSTSPSMIYVTGYNTANDNAFGSNLFKWNPTSTDADNGGTIIKLTGTDTGRYELQYDGAISVKWFGAVGDGITNDAPFFTLAGLLNTTINVPNGTYLLATTPILGTTVGGSKNVLVLAEDVTLTGAGTITTRIVKLSNGGAYGKATKIGANTSWLEAERVSTENNADMVVLSSFGQTGIIGGSRSSDFPIAGSMGCIGLSGWSINDNATEVQSSYAGYFESRRKAGAGTTHGIEVEVVNQGNNVITNPFGSFSTPGMTNGIWVASGGEIAATPASVAIGIVNNGASFNKGIVFQSNSISGTDGITGTGIAIAMAKGHVLNWYNSAGNSTSYIYSNASSLDLGAGIYLEDGRASFVNSLSGATKFSVEYSINDVNYIGITGAGPGLPANIKAMGADTDIDIRLSPKGNGVFAVTYGSTGVTTPANFSATRKLAFKDGNNVIWYLPVSTVPW